MQALPQEASRTTAIAAPVADNPWASTPVTPIRATNFLGWTNVFLLQNSRATAVLVPAIGRLVQFSTDAIPNLFRLDPCLQGKEPDSSSTFFNIGGDWIWPVAQSRWPSFSENGSDWPPPQVMADAAWDCSAWEDAAGTRCAMLTRKYAAPLNLIVSRLFLLKPLATELVIHQRIERTDVSDIPVVLWNVSQVANAEQVAMPVSPESRFPDGLCTLAGTLPSPDRLLSCGDVKIYLVSPGAEIKLGSDSPSAWLAAARGSHLLFESAAAGNRPGTPPDGGCVIEMYSNEGLGYTEIETLGPEVNLAPGTVLENTLRMRLAPLLAFPVPPSLPPPPLPRHHLNTAQTRPPLP